MVDLHQSKTSLSTGLALSGLTPLELVAGCAGIGDHIIPGRLEEMLATSAPRTAVEHDVVAVALDEHLPTRAWATLCRPATSSSAARRLPSRIVTTEEDPCASAHRLPRAAPSRGSPSRWSCLLARLPPLDGRPISRSAVPSPVGGSYGVSTVDGTPRRCCRSWCHLLVQRFP